MNHINPAKWSDEWYGLTTTDELTTFRKELQQLIETSHRMGHDQRLLWEERIKRISEELIQRQTSGDEWQEP